MSVNISHTEFNLSTWKDDKQSIRGWLVLELKSKYGVRKDIGAKWVDDAKLLPMLDGLDELESVHQEPCVSRINEFLQSDYRPLYMVVCSRREEYEKVVRGQWEQNKEEDLEEVLTKQNTRLYLNGAMILQSLTDKQIQSYLAGLNQLNSWKILQLDPELLKLVRTPLFLTILRFISFHQTLSLQEWEKLTSSESRQKYLLNAYWRAAIKRELTTPEMELKNLKSHAYGEKSTPKYKQTQKWLIYLSRQLQKESKVEFLIEKIQPSWLLIEFQRKIYAGSIIVMLYVITITYLSLIVKLFKYQQVEIIFQFAISFAFGVIAFISTDVLFQDIQSIEFIKWSWLNANKTFKSYFYKEKFSILSINYSNILSNILIIAKSLICQLLSFSSVTDLLKFVVMFVIFVRYIPAIILMLIAAVPAFLFLFLPFLFVIALIHALVAGISSVEIEQKINPNQGIKQSAKNGIFFLVIGLLMAIFANLVNHKMYSLIGGLIAIGFGLAGGGFACIQHFILRLILYRKSYIPWNYARFLDYCTERLLLQRVGGRYRFIHRLLQEHFAAMPLEK